jgi:8-oxo-dGTP diphosphatase
MRVVVAALIYRDGRVLACRRRDDQSHAGKWEFPGGKVEQGETPAQALERELREELGIEARVGPEVTSFEYAYPGKQAVRLVFHQVREFAGDPDFSQFAAARWTAEQELPELDFLEADVDLVKRLARGEFPSPRL